MGSDPLASGYANGSIACTVPVILNVLTMIRGLAGMTGALAGHLGNAEAKIVTDISLHHQLFVYKCNAFEDQDSSQRDHTTYP